MDDHRLEQRTHLHTIASHFTREEVDYLSYQLGTLRKGSFKHHLIMAISCADDANKAALAKGFPALVSAIGRWQFGDLATVARELGLEV